MADSNNLINNGGLRELELNFPDGSTATVTVDYQTYRSAVEEEDQSVIGEIVKNYKELQGQTEGAVSQTERTQTCSIPDAVSQTERNQTCSIPDAVSQTERTQTCSIPDAVSQTEKTQTEFNVHTSDTVNWRHEEVLLLISLYADHQEMFSNSAYKAFQVWKKIAEEMAAKGYRFTGLQCDKKFRSLKYRYKTIVDASEKTGRGRRKWEFFEAMDELLTGDPSVRPVSVLSSTKVTSKPPLPPRTQEAETTVRAIGASQGTPVRVASPVIADTPPRIPLTPARAPTPPLRASTPPGRSASPAESDQPRKRRRSSSSEAPVWFTAFAEEHQKQVQAMLESTQRLAAAAEKRNETLSRLVEEIIKRK